MLKFYVPVIFLVPIIASTIIFFGIEIKPEEDGDLYYWTFSEFGKTIIYKIISIIVILPESLLLVMILTVMNILTLRDFIQYSKNKAVLRSLNRREQNNQNIQFTRIIIILTILFIVTALFDNSSAIFARLIILFELELNQETIAIGDCIRQFTLLLIFIIHSFDVFIYVPMDRNLRRLIRRLFSRN